MVLNHPGWLWVLAYRVTSPQWKKYFKKDTKSMSY